MGTPIQSVEIFQLFISVPDSYGNGVSSFFSLGFRSVAFGPAKAILSSGVRVVMVFVVFALANFGREFPLKVIV